MMIKKGIFSLMLATTALSYAASAVTVDLDELEVRDIVSNKSYTVPKDAGGFYCPGVSPARAPAEFEGMKFNMYEGMLSPHLLESRDVITGKIIYDGWNKEEISLVMTAQKVEEKLKPITMEEAFSYNKEIADKYVIYSTDKHNLNGIGGHYYWRTLEPVTEEKEYDGQKYFEPVMEDIATISLYKDYNF